MITYNVQVERRTHTTTTNKQKEGGEVLDHDDDVIEIDPYRTMCGEPERRERVSV